MAALIAGETIQIRVKADEFELFLFSYIFCHVAILEETSFKGLVVHRGF